jgi:hypothetical protein
LTTGKLWVPGWKHPTAVQIVRVSQGGIDYITGDFAVNCLNIIVPQSAISITLVDGSTVDAANFVPIGTSGYHGAQVTVTNALDTNGV